MPPPTAPTARFRDRVLLAASTILFGVPLLVAWEADMWPMVVLIGCVIAVSLIYHLSGRRRFARPDAVLAWALIAANLWLCIRGGFAEPYFGIALLGVAAALPCYFLLQRKRPVLGHGLWHLFSALITLASVSTFLRG